MKKTILSTLVGCSMFALPLAASAAGQIGYLGPAGSWTHQACLDLFGPADLVPPPQVPAPYESRVLAKGVRCFQALRVVLRP